MYMYGLHDIMQGQNVVVNTEIRVILYGFHIVNKSYEKTKVTMNVSYQQVLSPKLTRAPNTY